MPKFSVIIPAYNRAALIGATLDSVLGQTAPDLEVIVVDDGSKDKTREVAASYGPRVRVLEQANKGPGAARNLGLTVATGEYVAYLDSDDLWFPWTAEAYWGAIEQHGRPAFLTGRPLVFTDAGQLGGACAEREEISVFKDYLASSAEWAWFSASSFVMRADALRAVGGMCDRWVNCEDADLALRLGTSAGFATFRRPYTFAWRSHSGSAMSAIRKTVAGYQFILDNEGAGVYPGGAERARERHEIIARHVRYGAMLCLEGRPPLLREGLDLYRRTLTWNVELGRLKFAAGFPVKAVLAGLKGGGGGGGGGASSEVKPT